MARKLPPLAPALDARDAVDEARAAFQEAVEDWCARLDTTPLAHAYAAWQRAVEAYNEIVYGLTADYTGFIEDHSDRWQESERGQQVVEAADTLENCQMPPEADIPLELRLEVDGAVCVVSCDNVEDVLPEAPELPEEVE